MSSFGGFVGARETALLPRVRIRVGKIIPPRRRREDTSPVQEELGRNKTCRALRPAFCRTRFSSRRKRCEVDAESEYIERSADEVESLGCCASRMRKRDRRAGRVEQKETSAG